MCQSVAVALLVACDNRLPVFILVGYFLAFLSRFRLVQRNLGLLLRVWNRVVYLRLAGTEAGFADDVFFNDGFFRHRGLAFRGLFLLLGRLID